MSRELVKSGVIQRHTKEVNACAISPDGSLLATAGDDGRLCVTSLSTHDLVYTANCDDSVSGTAWSPIGTYVVGVTQSGSVIKIDVALKSHATVFKFNEMLYGCAIRRDGIVAVCGSSTGILLLDLESDSFETMYNPRGTLAVRVAFSPDGEYLAAGCTSGDILIYGRDEQSGLQMIARLGGGASPTYGSVLSLCFSGEYSILATHDGSQAELWNAVKMPTWSKVDTISLEGHIDDVIGGAFLSDGSHVVTGTRDGSLCVWRAADGVQTAIYECGNVASLNYAASGIIVLGCRDGHVEIWQTDSHIAPSTAPQTAPQEALPAHECVRERLAAAQAEANTIQASIEKADSGLLQKMSREQELKRSIADLEAKLASEKKELADLQTPEYIAQSREFSKLMERHNELLGVINVCTQTLDSLVDCLSVSGLEDLRSDVFKEWLCDIGMGKLQTALKDIDGCTLTMLNVDNVMEYDVTFNDAASLLLRGYIAHYKLSDDSAFTPPRDTVLSWDDKQTANWIQSLGAPFESLASAGWHGAALCSLSLPRVLEASKGVLKVPDAVKFITLIKAMRSEMDGEKATWVSKWIGTSTIEMHPF